MNLAEKILHLKKKKNALILAHYYQRPEIQELADFVGDSLNLAAEARKTTADIIVFAGVYFMAETAKITNPEKKVLIPDLNAGCSLADSCSPADFTKFLNHYPDHCVVAYVNCSAEIKALSDLCCTSSNAVRVINSIPKETPVVFAPDKNLGQYLARQTGRDLVLWNGACHVHEAFSTEKLKFLKLKYPAAKLIAHPESEDVILRQADFIGSTSALLSYVRKDDSLVFLVATEAGILHKMVSENIEKKFIPVPAAANNSCACSECDFMKLNTLGKLYTCLRDESPEVTVSENLRRLAEVPLRRMFEIAA
jgi:quinolinate synthase